MTKGRTRILSIVLTICMLFSLTPAAFAVSAQDFTDVPADAWYYDDVDFVVQNKYFEGLGEGVFSPETSMTRAMFVTVLSRLDGVEAGDDVSPFPDVASGMWYAGEVAWAFENKLVDGVSENSFAPEQDVTREQMAALMARFIAYYIEKHELTLEAKGSSEPFSDAAAVSSYAAEAVTLCRSYGLVDGLGDGRFGPTLPSKRAEVAAVIHRLSVLLNTAGEAPASPSPSPSPSSGGGGGGGGAPAAIIPTTTLAIAPLKTLSVGSGYAYTEALTVNRDGTGPIAWRSDKPETVRVDPATGRLSALKVGTATIYAECDGVGGSTTVSAVNPTMADDEDANTAGLQYTITEPGTVLENCSFAKLTIARNVGVDDVTLTGVSALDLDVQGGGSRSVKLDGGSYDNVGINNASVGGTRILTTGNVAVANVTVGSGASNGVILETETGSSASIGKVTSEAPLNVKGVDVASITTSADLTVTNAKVTQVETEGSGAPEINLTGSTVDQVKAGAGSTKISGDSSVPNVEASKNIITDVPVGNIAASGNANVTASGPVSSVTGEAGSIKLKDSGGTAVDATAYNLNVEGASKPTVTKEVGGVNVVANAEGSSGVNIMAGSPSVSTTGSGSGETVGEISIGGSASPTVNASNDAPVGTVSVSGSAAPVITGKTDTIVSTSSGNVNASGADAQQVLASDTTKVNAGETKAQEVTPVLEYIAVTSSPTKTVYKTTDDFDDAGLVVTAYYTIPGFDGAVSKIVDVTPTGFVKGNAGTQSISVSYTDGSVTATTSFTVTVVAKELSRISLTKLPDTRLYDIKDGGVSLDATGLEVTAYYTSALYAAETVNPPAPSATFTTIGAKTVTVLYEEGYVTKAASFTVNVINSAKDDFDTALAKAKNDFLAYVATALKTAYSETGKAAVKDAQTAGIEALKNATSSTYDITVITSILATQTGLVDAIPTQDEEWQAVADTFKDTAYAAILTETAATVEIADRADVTAALNAYNGLVPGVRAKLTAQKTTLDGLLAKIVELEAARDAAIDLGEAKTNAKATLTSTLANVYPASAYGVSQSEIVAAKGAGDTAIDNAADKAAVTAALNAALANMASYPSDAEVLATAKVNAINELNAYLPLSKIKTVYDAYYNAAGKALVADARAAGVSAINAATSTSAVTTALADAKLVVDAVKTAAVMDAEALAAFKTTAKGELNAYGNPNNYRSAQRTELTNERAAGCSEIDAVTLTGTLEAAKAAVTEALKDAKAAIGALKTAAQLDAEELPGIKTNAKAELAIYKEKANYSSGGWLLVQGKVSAWGLTIDACANAAAVANAVEDAKNELDGLDTAPTEQGENAKLVSDAKANIPVAYTADQADAADAAAAKAAAEAAVAKLALPVGVTATVNAGTFNAAVAGDGNDLDGTNGSYTFTVTLTAGKAADGTYGNTFATVTTDTCTMTITATISGEPDNQVIADAAKTKVEATAFGPVPQASYGTETKLAAYVKGVAEAAAGSGITVTVNKISYTPPTPETTSASGVNGTYKFTVTLTKGEKHATTTEITLTITATAYSAASIGSVGYPSLEAALVAAQNGQTIKLGGNVTLEAPITVKGLTLTLDLNGNSITRSNPEKSADPAVIATNGAKLTVTGTGSIICKDEANKFGTPLNVNPGGTKDTPDSIAASTITLDSKVTVTGGYAGAYLYDNGKLVVDGATVQGRGYGVVAREAGAALDVKNNGTVKSTDEKEGYGISGNGTDGVNTTTISISSGTVYGAEVGIYHPQTGTLTITGGDISGAAGIEMRAGDLNIPADSTAIITGTGAGKSESNPSGATTAGAGIAIVQHGTKKPINVTIAGGVIKATGENSTAVFENNTEGNTDEYVKLVKVIISGGTFTGVKAAVTLNDYAKLSGETTITGGTFSSDPGAYVDGRYKADKVGGEWKVSLATQANAAASVGSVYYANLPAAIAAAKTGDTVKLERDVTLPAGAAPAIYDLGGKTLDLNGKTLSSANYKSVFVGDNGTIKNGSLKCLDGGSYALFIGDEKETNGFTVEAVSTAGGINIYNASNVVLRNVNATGTNFYAVWLDENSTATIESGTYSSASTKTTSLLGVTDTSEGKKSELVIKGGEYTVNSDDSLLTGDGTLSITGGTFSSDPGAYVDGRYKADKVGGEWKVSLATQANAAASVGGVYYANLPAAFAAAKDGQTVKLENDVTQDDGILIDRPGDTINLDLNGKTFTVNVGANVNNRAIKLNAGTLKVTGPGTMVAIGSEGKGAYGVFRVEKDGVLDLKNLELQNGRHNGLNVKVCGGKATLTGVTINSTGGGGIEVTKESDEKAVNPVKGTATLTNCTITQTGVFGWCSSAVAVSGGSSLTVESGSYSSDGYALYVFNSGGTITVEDGTFNGYEAAAQVDTSTVAGDLSAMILEGGSYTGALVSTPASLSITGGTFSVDPSEYVGSTYAATEDTTTNKWTVAPRAAANAEASIGNVNYKTLGDAIAAAKSGDTIKLENDVTLPAGDTPAIYDLGGKTLDLNGKTLSSENYKSVFVGDNGTIKNGNLFCSGGGSYALFLGRLGTANNFTVDGVQTTGGINIRDASNVVIKNSTVTGTNFYAVWLDENVTATIESGTYSTASIKTTSLLGVTATSGGEKSELVIKGGEYTVNSDDSLLIGDGTLSITGGTFNVDPSKYVASGYSAEKDGDVWKINGPAASIGGTKYASLAEAIAADNSGEPIKLERDVTLPAGDDPVIYDLSGKTLDLNGKTLSSANYKSVFVGDNGVIKNGSLKCLDGGSYALWIGDAATTDDFTVENVSTTGGINVYNASNVTLKNVTAAGTDYYAVWLDQNAFVTINGGSYSTASTNAAYLLGASAVNKDGTTVPSELTIKGGAFTVNSDDELFLSFQGEGRTAGGILSIEGGTFSDLSGLLYTADGGTYTLNQSASGDGVAVPGGSNFILDLGKHTYTIDGTTVGSAGTKTNGFQLLKGSDITIKNGTIASTKAKMLIQNYSNLTLEDVTLDGSGTESACQYVLSNNCGKVNITGSTSITAPAGQFAFDACWGPNNGYPEGTQVVVNTTGKITGKIEFGLWGTDVDTDCLTTLEIKNCDLDGEIVVGAGMEEYQKNISITGGTFTNDPRAYVASSYEATQDGGKWTVAMPTTPQDPVEP